MRLRGNHWGHLFGCQRHRPNHPDVTSRRTDYQGVKMRHVLNDAPRATTVKVINRCWFIIITIYTQRNNQSFSQRDADDRNEHFTDQCACAKRATNGKTSGSMIGQWRAAHRPGTSRRIGRWAISRVNTCCVQLRGRCLKEQA